MVLGDGWWSWGAQEAGLAWVWFWVVYGGCSGRWWCRVVGGGFGVPRKLVVPGCGLGWFMVVGMPRKGGRLW